MHVDALSVLIAKFLSALVLEDSEHSEKAFYLVHVGTFLPADNH